MVDDDPLRPGPTSRMGRTKDRSGTKKGDRLAFVLSEPRRWTQCKCCQPLSPTCDCSRNIATPCYRLRGVGNNAPLGSCYCGRRAAHTSHERESVGVSSSFGENAAICLQRGRRPDGKSHLPLTLIAAVDSNSCVAPLRQRLNRCDVHFAAALAGGAFRTTGLQQSFKHV
jgi:hypothetical protein